MKKKLLGILLSLALMTGMMPAVSLTAYADTEDYKLFVGDIKVTSTNAANITNSNPIKASYDVNTNTLTLNNYTYEGSGSDDDDVSAAIKARMDRDFTIKLIGENTVKHVYKKTSAGAGIYADNNMTITGDGTLTVSDGDNASNFNSRGIRVGENITIGSGTTVNAASGKGQNSYGVNVKQLTVQGKLNATGGNANNSYGVYTSNGIIVDKSGKLKAVGDTATNGSYGAFIYKTEEKLSIEGAMTARGNTFAIAKAANPNPSVNTTAIQYTIPVGYRAKESVNYDGSTPTSVPAGGKTSTTAKYVWVSLPVSVTGVSLNKTSTTLTVDEKERLSATVEPEEATDPDLEWDSSNSGVAIVSGNGEVTALAAGEATITVRATNGTDDTGDDKTATCKVSVTEKPAPKPTVKVTVPAGKTFTYTGKIQTGVASGSNYTLTGITKATNVGTYTVTATLTKDDNHTYIWDDGTTEVKSITWKINKAKNPLTIKAKKAKVIYSKLKKKNQTLSVTKVIKFTGKGQGKMIYTKISGNKKIIIKKTTGKVTVRKGLKKGIYKIRVRVRAFGNANYKASAWKKVAVMIIVK